MKPERGLAIGVFDLFHVGHLRYLHYASKQCQKLIVAVTPDSIGLEMKGQRPIIPQEQRIEIVQSLGYVSEAKVLPCTTEYTESAVVWIREWDIHCVIGGGAWEGSERWGRLEPALAAVGISTCYAPHTHCVSSTQIIETVLETMDSSC